MVSIGPMALGDSTSTGGVSGGAKAGEGGRSRREFDLRREPKEVRVNGGRTLVEDARWRLGGGTREAIRPARRARGLMKSAAGRDHFTHVPARPSAALSVLSHVTHTPSSSSSAPVRVMNQPPVLRYPPLLGPAKVQRHPRSVLSLSGRQTRLSLALQDDCSSPVALPSYICAAQPAKPAFADHSNASVLANLSSEAESYDTRLATLAFPTIAVVPVSSCSCFTAC